MVVADPTPPAILQMVPTEEVLLIGVPLGPVRCRALARALELGQQKEVVAIDEPDIGIQERLLLDMARVDVCDLESIYVLQRPGRWAGSQIAAVAEGRCHVTLPWSGQPPLRA